MKALAVAKTALLVVLAIFQLQACHVKEDRSDCPCLLTVILPEEGGEELRLIVVQPGEGSMWQETVLAEGGQKSFSVTKGDVIVALYSQMDKIILDEEALSLTLSSGGTADSLYVHSNIVDCRGETAVDEAVMRKQWCTLELSLEDPGLWESYNYEIVGSWDGLWLGNLVAKEGSFSCIPCSSGEGLLKAYIPRQGDNELSLLVSDGSNGEIVQEIAIGEVMESLGYDWDKEDLDDLSLTLSHSVWGFSIEIRDWIEGSF